VGTVRSVVEQSTARLPCRGLVPPATCALTVTAEIHLRRFVDMAIT
jgi:hypothetical protein